MIQQDYLQRQLQQLTRVLGRMIARALGTDHNNATAEEDVVAFTALAGFQPEALLGRSAATIAATVPEHLRRRATFEELSRYFELNAANQTELAVRHRWLATAIACLDAADLATATASLTAMQDRHRLVQLLDA